jgi:hypothetical protein
MRCKHAHHKDYIFSKDMDNTYNKEREREGERERERERERKK